MIRLLKGLCTSIIIFSILNPLPLFAEDYQTFLEKGDEYHQNFDNSKALEEYEKAYELATMSVKILIQKNRNPISRKLLNMPNYTVREVS